MILVSLGKWPFFGLKEPRESKIIDQTYKQLTLAPFFFFHAEWEIATQNYIERIYTPLGKFFWPAPVVKLMYRALIWWFVLFWRCWNIFLTLGSLVFELTSKLKRFRFFSEKVSAFFRSVSGVFPALFRNHSLSVSVSTSYFTLGQSRWVRKI